MKKKQIIGLLIAGLLFAVIGVISVFVNTAAESIIGDAAEEILAGGSNFDPPDDDYIAVVKVQGTIQEQASDTTDILSGQNSGYQHDTTMEYLDELMDDENNKGILLYVDSPGGAVYESEELYDKLMEYKKITKQPIWTYMAHYAASGGYMASVSSDKIYANKNTVTGSIGVIMSGYDLTGLYKKLGIRYVSITSGKNKDSSRLTKEQVKIYQSQVDECYEAFVSKVADGRKMSKEQVKKLADGRTYTATQAKINGLIDKISSYDEMQDEMSDKLKTDEFYEPERKTNLLDELFAKAGSLVPKSEAQVLKETAEECKSGGLMYYAEGLQ